MYQQEQVMNTVSDEGINARVAFIRRTYAHLLAAVIAFVALEFAIFSSGMAQPMAEAMLGVNWLFVLGAWMGVSWLADWWAQSDTSPILQYVGLSVFVVAEAIIFVPLLYMAAAYSSPEVIPSAALTTAVVFSGLTVSVFVTKKDFSFMRGFLIVASLGALGTIVAGSIFGFGLGLWFSAAMVLLSGGYILYQTSAIMRHYNTSQHVAAALALFSSVAMLFWYILRIFMARD